MTDSWSKAFLSVPVKKRGGQASVAHMVDGVVRFSTQLGYSSICLKADNEGSCKAVKEQVQKKRGALGLSTTLADSVPHAHVTNISIVHVTLRAQCRLYVSHVMFRLKPHPRQTVAAVVKVCRLWLGRSGVEKCRVDHKIGSKTFMVAELLAKASS